MGERLQISVILSGLSMLYGEDLEGMVETARLADEAGIDQIVITDHLAIGPRTDRYPYGKFPFPNEEPWPEPLTTLAVMAGATSRVRLGTGVLIVPLRPALLLAKTLATLDVLSGGRIDLGVGTGWQREEFDAAGVPFVGRTARMEDTLRACRALWRDAPASFTSDTVSFEDVWCLPRPKQPGGVPIWIGGGLTEGNLRRLLEFGAGWMPVAPDLAELREGGEKIRAAFAAAGRDASSVGIRGAVAPVRGERGPDMEKTLAQLAPLQEAGATWASFALAAFVRKREQIPAFFEKLGKAAGR
jgi:probable F420-dependent oxidoreductase